MGIRLQRHLGPADAVPPGHWCNDLARHAEGRMAMYVIGCPICGTVFDLPSTHTVASGGEVSPAVACRNGETCPFLEFVVFDGHGEPT